MENTDKIKTEQNGMQNGKNNYTFNNCTVTINEEGKAINALEEKLKIESKTMDMLTSITTTFTTIATDLMKRKAEREEQLKAELAKKRQRPAKKATVKKTSKKK